MKWFNTYLFGVVMDEMVQFLPLRPEYLFLRCHLLCFHLHRLSFSLGTPTLFIVIPLLIGLIIGQYLEFYSSFVCKCLQYA